MKEDYQKALKKLISFFLLNPVPFNGQSYLKQKGSGTSEQALFRLQSEFRNIPLLVIYYLNKFDDIKQFLSYSKNCISNLCKAIYDIINYSSSNCLFESGKCGKEGKNTKMWISQDWKSFLDEIESIFHSFWRAIIWWKNKNLIKIFW